MCGKIFIICLIALGAVLQGCASAESQSAETVKNEVAVSSLAVEPTPPFRSEIQKFGAGKVNCKGVSFDYNPQVFDRVAAEEISRDLPLGMETDKPGEDFPKHTEFYFETNSTDKGRLVIIPIDRYREMYAVSNSLLNALNDNLNELKTVLNGGKLAKSKGIPIVPFYDAHQPFAAKIKNIPFQNGKSICQLTRFSQEQDIVTDDGVVYYCQGMTNDKKYYVLAEFVVSVPFLSKSEYTDEFEDYKLPKIPSNMTKKEVREYENYLSKLARRIESLPENQFTPNLSEFEKIISSLKIQN